MYKNTRIIKICERCKTKLNRKFQFKDYLPIITDGWHSEKGKLLCPSCYSHYIHIFEKFMRNEI